MVDHLLQNKFGGSDLIQKIVKHTLEEHPRADRWSVMARGLGKSLNNELFSLSSPSRLDWTGLLMSRNLHIHDRPAEWYDRSVILPIHKADLILVVSNVPSL